MKLTDHETDLMIPLLENGNFPGKTIYAVHDLLIQLKAKDELSDSNRKTLFSFIMSIHVPGHLVPDIAGILHKISEAGENTRVSQAA